MIRFALLVCLLQFLATAAEPSDTVTLQLKWKHQFQFAGYYMAREKGYFAKEGLNVRFRQRTEGTKDHYTAVSDGDAQYGVGDSGLLLKRKEGYPFVLIAQIFQHSPIVFVALKQSGIVSPYEMVGKKISYEDDGINDAPLNAMLVETLKSADAVHKVPFTFDNRDLLEGKVDAMMVYLTDQPFWFKEHGAQVNVINPQSYGIDFYGDNLFTTDAELESHPERVEKMRRAVIEGWEYALRHPRETIDLILDKYNPQHFSRAHLEYEAAMTARMILPDLVPIGEVTRKRLETIARHYHEMGYIDNSEVPEKLLYTEQLQHLKLQLTPEEHAWLKAHPVIRLAADVNWKPFEFIDKTGRYRGLAADYIERISETLGIRFEVNKEIAWDEAVTMMRRRELDMFSCAVETPERSVYADFTRPYLSFPMIIATGDDVTYIENMKELDFKRVALVKGYATYELITRNHPDIEIVDVASNLEGLQAVSNGLAYAYIGNLAAISYVIREQGLSNLKISGQTPYRFELAMAARNDWPEFAPILQKALDAIDREEQDRIYNRWLRVEYAVTTDYGTLVKVGAAALAILALLFVYNRKLKSVNHRLHNANDALEEAQTQLKLKNDELRRLSVTDKLTGAFNRHRLDQVLLSEVERANRYHRPLGLIILDLDNFKQVNDRYGHQVGDHVLQRASEVVHDQIRQNDTFGRWGGEEFMLICPETGQVAVEELAEKLRSALARALFETVQHQSASFGACSYRFGETVHDFVSRCDDALYRAKDDGKNCVRSC